MASPPPPAAAAANKSTTATNADEANRPPKDRRASMARLMELARGESKLLGIGTAFLVLGSITSLLYPQGLSRMVDQALKQASGQVAAGEGGIGRIALLMLAVAIVNGIAVALRYAMFSIAGERIVTRLRERLYRSIISQEIGFFDERRTGELTSRLASDTAVLQNSVSANISMVLRNAATVVGAIGFLLYTSPKLTLLMLSVVPPIAIASVFYGRRVRKLSKSVQDALAEASEVAEESISGIRTVRSFAAEDKEAARYDSSVQRSFGLARKRIVAGSTFMAAASTAAYASLALVLWSGARLVAAKEMTVGDLTSFLIYSLLVAFSLGALSDLWADFMKSLGAAERVFELVERQPLIPARGGRRLDSPSGTVAFEHVGFSYPTRPDVRVLDDVNLEIKQGEVVAVVGPSGAGKSTLSSLLARFYDPQSGRVRLDGVDLRELDPEWLRRKIGTVAQEPILFSTTIAENIRYGRPDATDAEVEAAAKAANAHDFVGRFPQGYATLVGERGVQLSGGQKQRVAIARAVLKDPLLLILDEATSALDAESEHLVKEALDRLMRGRTTLVIAHRLSTVIGADRVLVVDGGRVVQAGSHRVLMAEEGLYRKLVERQFVQA